MGMKKDVAVTVVEGREVVVEGRDAALLSSMPFKRKCMKSSIPMLHGVAV